MQKMNKILIIEDDESISKLIEMNKLDTKDCKNQGILG